MRAAVAFFLLALAGCTLQRGPGVIEPSAAGDPDDYILKPIASFPAHKSDCEEMPDGSCELRPRMASSAPTSRAPRPIARTVRSKTLQPSAPTPVVVASVDSAPPVVSAAASTPAQVPAPKPDDNDPKTASDVLNDAAIAALIIQASREAYYTAGHSCPCPYDLAPNGRLCGHHSAHSRHRGGALRCFAIDVTADQIAGYRAKLASK